MAYNKTSEERKNYIFYSYDPMIYVSDAHPIEVIEDQKKIDKLPIGYYNVSNRMVTNKRRGQFLHSYYFLTKVSKNSPSSTGGR